MKLFKSSSFPYSHIAYKTILLIGISSILAALYAYSAGAQEQASKDNIVKENTAPAPAPAPAPEKIIPSDELAKTSPLLVEYGPLTFSPLVKKVVPAVVNIAVSQNVPIKHPKKIIIPPSVRGTPLEKEFRQRQHQQQQKITEAGSGFIIDPSGIIVTNTHVIGDSSDITVSLQDGTQLPASVIGNDSLTDIAVIKINAHHPLPYVKWGDSKRVEVGDWILTTGNPFGLGSSVTAGIVSARGRDIGSGPFDDFLQLDAPMNPGNSGGPSFNLAGQVIALNTAIVSPTGSSVGIGFGIPSEIVAPIVTQLCKTGFIDRGWLGVTLGDDDRRDGVRIVDIDAKGPAYDAKIKVGDRIEMINSQHVDTVRTFMKTVAMAHPGSKIELLIKRNKRKFNIVTTVGHRPKDADN
ncbi:S1C family serine protease [Commensalibacter communis]|uniref:S1C family serine protease n=1 Tax=Commensalibacter communis TaxID=2972786 RepID=UPI0022FFA983|nr:trypsin-like peptidase domain-containing protein [Commensalibacter communis]CAI3927204.1 Periplasmic serine protease [Commensalibacter communis]CAI3927465.1 Periplasmic serine protease [Commensalibacter communis]